jgi:hypothetical protein
MEELYGALRPSGFKKVAGSGNKFVHLSEELSNYYINLVPGFKFWDMVASEALLTSRFGVVTDAKQ